MSAISLLSKAYYSTIETLIYYGFHRSPLQGTINLAKQCLHANNLHFKITHNKNLFQRFAEPSFHKTTVGIISNNQALANANIQQINFLNENNITNNSKYLYKALLLEVYNSTQNVELRNQRLANLVNCFNSLIQPKYSVDGTNDEYFQEDHFASLLVNLYTITLTKTDLHYAYTSTINGAFSPPTKTMHDLYMGNVFGNVAFYLLNFTFSALCYAFTIDLSGTTTVSLATIYASIWVVSLLADPFAAFLTSIYNHRFASSATYSPRGLLTYFLFHPLSFFSDIIHILSTAFDAAQESWDSSIHNSNSIHPVFFAAYITAVLYVRSLAAAYIGTASYLFLHPFFDVSFKVFQDCLSGKLLSNPFSYIKQRIIPYTIVGFLRAIARIALSVPEVPKTDDQGLPTGATGPAITGIRQIFINDFFDCISSTLGGLLHISWFGLDPVN